MPANYDIWSRWWFWSTATTNLTMSTAALTVVVFLVVACITTFYLPIRRKSKHAALPPGPRGFPVLGYLPFLGIDLHREFAKLSETYGPIFKLWLGKKLCIIISSPVIAKEIVREQDLLFANRDRTISSDTMTFGGYDIAFADYGEYWRKMRKIFVRELMSNRSLDACCSLRRLEIRKCISSLSDKVGNPVDIGELVLLAVVNMAMAMVWGGSIEVGRGENFASEFRKVAAEMMVILGQPNVSDFFPFLARFDLQGVETRAKKTRVWFHSFLDTIIDRAIKERADRIVERSEEEAAGGEYEQKNNILQILLDFELNEDEDQASPNRNRELKAIITDIFVGATDTTATMLEWAISELFCHREVMEKVTEELTQVVGSDSMVEEFHLPALKYLDAVIMETFRLHPPLPLLVPRTPSKTTTVCGYTIPTGAKVFLNVWAIHRDPQLWEEPLEFRPERFLDNRGSFDFSGNNFQFMPFGSGRRVCPGVPLAEKMAKYLLASLLHSFHWQLPEGAEPELADKFGIVLKKMNPLVAIPRAKLSESVLDM